MIFQLKNKIKVKNGHANEEIRLIIHCQHRSYCTMQYYHVCQRVCARARAIYIVRTPTLVSPGVVLFARKDVRNNNNMCRGKNYI